MKKQHRKKPLRNFNFAKAKHIYIKGGDASWMFEMLGWKDEFK